MTVNPIIFRLGSKTTWDPKYFGNKLKELKIFSNHNIQINKFLKNFLKKYGLKLLQSKLYQNKNSVFVFLNYDFSNSKKEPKFIFNKLTNELLLFKNLFNKKTAYCELIKLTSFYRLKHKTLVYFNNFFKFLHFISQKLKKYHRLFKNHIKFNCYFSKFKFTKLLNLGYDRLNTLNFKKFQILKFQCLIKNQELTKKFVLNLFLKKIKNVLKSFLKSDFNFFLLLRQVNKNNFVHLTVKQKKKLMVDLLNLKKFQKSDFFEVGANLVFNCNEVNIGFVIANLIKTQLSKAKDTKIFNSFLRFLVNTMKHFLLFNKKIQGIEIKIKGNLTKKQRAVIKNIVLGKRLPKTKINSQLKFNQTTVYSKKGTFGINIWVF